MWFCCVKVHHLHFDNFLFIMCSDPLYLLSSFSSSLQSRTSISMLIFLSVTLVVPFAFVFIPPPGLHPPSPNPVRHSVHDTVDPVFVAHLNAWRTTWDKKGIHRRATRRTPETQIYFFNTVNITVPGNTLPMERGNLRLENTFVWYILNIKQVSLQKHINSELNFSFNLSY